MAVSVVFLIVGVYALRQNNFRMIELRQAVITADEKNGDVETALANLRDYVYGHMNTNLSSGQNAIKPPIQLKGRYERLTASKQAQIKADNQAIQAQGEAVCAAQFPGAGFNSPRVSCVQAYVAANAKQSSTEIPAELYKFDFVSPRWSPDLAGISLLFSAGFFVLFILRFVAERWMIAKIK